MITISNLSKKFGDKAVLNNLNLQFGEDKVYGIVGENGAGKITLFRCMAGLEDYNRNINSDLRPLKDHLGLLFTDPFFFTKLTGKEYIRLLCNARKRDKIYIEDKNIFDLPLNQYASTYSTGMKKKLALLAILLQGNQYFILDETFNGVDIHSNMIITELIIKLKSMGKTVIVSSHIFSTLRDTCDEIFLLKDGNITKRVLFNDFDELESEMKEFTIGNKIDQLELL